MRILRFMILLGIVAMSMGGQNAAAFSVDTKADMNSDGSARFTDPEDSAMAKFGLSDNSSSDQSGFHGTSLGSINALQPGVQNAPVIQQKYR